MELFFVERERGSDGSDSYVRSNISFRYKKHILIFHLHADDIFSIYLIYSKNSNNYLSFHFYYSISLHSIQIG